VGASARLAGQRRARRAKTERLDGHQGLTMRRRHTAGAKKGWSGVRGPSGVAADRRQRPRARWPTKHDRPRGLHRIPGLLAGEGIRLAGPGDVAPQRDAVRPWDGPPRPAARGARRPRAWPQVQGRTEPSGGLEAERRAAWRPRAERGLEQGRPWATRRGMGGKSAGRCVREGFAGRDVQTPKQVGAGAGLPPPPEQRGQASRERGMPQAGHGSRRTMAIEMAWGW
jgi:transposase